MNNRVIERTSFNDWCYDTMEKKLHPENGDSYERFICKAAWNYQQRKIDKLEKQLIKGDK